MESGIDINVDLGEGSGNDEQLMPLISSCNIACGGHYGTEVTMRKAVRLAHAYKVNVGAHPSFPDKDGFGRALITLTKEALSDTIYHQLLHFFAVCETEGVAVHHIKLHGALYHYAAIDAPTADAVVEAIIATKARPGLYLPYNSILHRKAENLLPLVFEAFIDRTYTESLSLVSRTEKEALILEPEAAWHQLKRMVFHQQVMTFTGKERDIVAQTYCIHGDNPNALAILRYIHKQMEIHNLCLS